MSVAGDNEEIFRQLFQLRLWFEEVGSRELADDGGNAQSSNGTDFTRQLADWQNAARMLENVFDTLSLLNRPLSKDELTKQSRLGLAIWNAAVRLATGIIGLKGKSISAPVLQHALELEAKCMSIC